MGRFDGEMREKGCLMSGAAARTGNLKKKEKEPYIKNGKKSLNKNNIKQ